MKVAEGQLEFLKEFVRNDIYFDKNIILEQKPPNPYGYIPGTDEFYRFELIRLSMDFKKKMKLLHDDLLEEVVLKIKEISNQLSGQEYFDYMERQFKKNSYGNTKGNYLWRINNNKKKLSKKLSYRELFKLIGEFNQIEHQFNINIKRNFIG